MMDTLHQFELEILQLLGVAIGSLILLALQRVLAWLHITLTAARQAALAGAVDKMMTLGVTQADRIIRANGWDHPDSKNAVINLALSGVETKFQTTLANAKINPDDPVDRLKLTEMMERLWPDVATRLAASPVTPPAPVVPTAIIAPAAG